MLRNVGNILKNANVSASLVSDQVKQSKIANVVHVGALIREHVKDLGDFMARDPRGQKLPVYIADLAEHLANEQTTLSNELESLRKTIEEAEAEQQSYTELMSKEDAAKKPLPRSNPGQRSMAARRRRPACSFPADTKRQPSKWRETPSARFVVMARQSGEVKTAGRNKY